MTYGISIVREAAISVVINGVLSLAFFLAVFGAQPRLLHWTGSDGLALDFVPQSLAVALMSALVPSLIARRRMGKAMAVRPILFRAALFALAGTVFSGLLAFTISQAGFAPVAWTNALAIKIAYGGALGALVASLALQRLLSSVKSFG
jgi:hypothetical protein